MMSDDLDAADMQELQAALEHTPIPHEDVIAKGHRTVWYTWFETFHKHSTLSCLFEVRNCWVYISHPLCTHILHLCAGHLPKLCM